MNITAASVKVCVDGVHEASEPEQPGVSPVFESVVNMEHLQCPQGKEKSLKRIHMYVCN